MKLITLTAGIDDFSLESEEGFPPEEMEWRLVQLAEERYPDYQHSFGYDSEGLPTIDLIKAGRIAHRLHFEVE